MFCVDFVITELKKVGVNTCHKNIKFRTKQITHSISLLKYIGLT